LLNEKWFRHSAIIGLTETHVKDITEIEGKTTLSKNTQHGLAIMVSKDIAINELTCDSDLEILATQINAHENQFIIVLIYRPPGPLNDFTNKLMHALNKLMDQNCKTVLMGDFNISDPTQLDTVLLERNFERRTKEPTHNQGGCLDLLYTNFHTSSNKPIPVYFTDHFLVSVPIN